MQLRNYQISLINNSRDCFKKGYKRCLLVCGCGSGKTITAAWLTNANLSKNVNNYCWFLVHREELIDQTIDTFTNNNIPLNNVLIGMVQTVSHHITDYNKPSMIIFDEAHHSTANTWLNIINAYPDTPIIGLTATPCRLDGKPLGNIYDSMAIGPSAKWLIDNNYLSNYEYYAPHINLEESKWQIKGSDYDMKSVEATIDKPGIYGDILKYVDIKRKTIIYCPSINYSIKLENALNTKYQGLAKHFDGGTPKQERKHIIEAFRRGDIRILLNVDLIGEGFDVPDADCCMLLRPTMSVALYIQQSMRCMRYQPGKTAIIYDFVGNVYKHGLPDDDREWSLDKPVKVRNKTDVKDLLVRECKNCFKIFKANTRICPYCGKDNGKTRKEIEEDNKAELERIKAVEKKKERMEVGMARTFESLVALGRKRGYRNPAFWASTIIKSRQSKI